MACSASGHFFWHLPSVFGHNIQSNCIKKISLHCKIHKILSEFFSWQQLCEKFNKIQGNIVDCLIICLNVALAMSFYVISEFSTRFLLPWIACAEYQ